MIERIVGSVIGVVLGVVFGVVFGVVLDKHPPRRNAFVQRDCSRLGGVLPCFNEVTSRWQRAVISLPTTLRLVRSANTPTLSNRKKITWYEIVYGTQRHKDTKFFPGAERLTDRQGFPLVKIILPYLQNVTKIHVCEQKERERSAYCLRNFTKCQHDGILTFKRRGNELAVMEK